MKTKNGSVAEIVSEVQQITLPPLELQEATFTLIGESPLIMHKWSEKAKKMMLDKQMKKATKGREVRNPKQEYEESIYRDAENNIVFPAVAFKRAAVRAGKQLGVEMTLLRCVFHVKGEWVKIEGKHRMREDIVRIGMGTADLRYRAEFPTWKCTITVSFNKNAISAEQIANLLQVAGFGVGIGEDRPETKGGGYGRFRLA